MAVITRRRTYCDKCDSDGEDVYRRVLEIGGGRVRRRVQIDACETCERTTKLPKWEALGQTKLVRNGRTAGRYVGVPYSESDGAPRRNAVRRHVHLGDAVSEFADAREALGTPKPTQRAELRLLDRLLLVNGNIYVRDLGPRQIERMFAEKRPSDAEVERLQLFITWCVRNRWLNGADDLLLPYRTTPPRRGDPFDELVSGTCLRCRRAGWVTPFALENEERVRFTFCSRCHRNATLANVLKLVRRDN